VDSKNEWMSRHARRLLQERAARGSLSAEVQTALRTQLLHAPDTAARLRNLWALHLLGPVQNAWIPPNDVWVRAWALQLAAEEWPTLRAEDWNRADVQGAWGRLLEACRQTESPVVRRYAASALQRVPVAQRWEALTALVQHAEDASDHNLPQLYWMAAEGGAATDPERAVALLKASKIPKIREFIARRLATGSLARN